ncbi:putative ABC transporter ATP-binding protein YbhF [Ruminiclostridium hungatei]|uniref:Putative ABC transporter ATP-binding protein YbhF n=1 Tax=Ruminiclostridium hungatei TaxID=48256 RepID=A0A1V4SP44_RUMHU|nr:ATP-binding cassette domain-containing protein [Ruminiclostridium hungatei]OPX45246.1 putative ABC transporter ATP-binding protein YbhF [Ruminiclostridium hungatei]
MNQYIIDVEGLNKVFKVHKRDKAGLLSSLKSLFSRDYTLVTAVAGLDLKIRQGEIRGLIGPNGAGKSTTIKILSGILYPSEGKVNVMGYTPWTQREEYVKNIGVVFGQKSQLWWDLPAIDTFALNRQMYGISDKTFDENLSYFKELLKIGDVISKPVRQLSLGERMKCEFVCAMLHQPPLVYLDEPTIGLDIISKEAIRSFIKSVNRDRGTTFIVTTHDLSDIEDLCENVSIINSGNIVFNDCIDKLKTYFSDKKIIEVKFNRQVDPALLEGFKVISGGPFNANIEIETLTTSLQDEISRIFKILPVQDINVNNINIEEVIKYIYLS